jgi:hypothetical protein
LGIDLLIKGSKLLERDTSYPQVYESHYDSMSRSFGIVEKKVEESEFFLSKIIESMDKKRAFDETQFYLSAFASSTRSITFTIQASISDIPGFDNWYKSQQEKLKSNKLARFFLEARNLSQKIGYYLIGSGRSYTDQNGDLKMYHYFQTFSSNQLSYVPEEDVLTCITYYKILLEVVMDCYKEFGKLIDPEKFFTIENLRESNKTIEDFEEQASYPRGWTEIPNYSIEQRIDLIKRHHPIPEIDWIFEKYFNKNRFGEKIETCG